MRQWNSTSKIIPTMIFTSVLFSLSHALNIFQGAPILPTLEQLIFTFGFGMAAAALFIRTGSIWPSIAMHFCADIWGCLNTSAVNKSGLAIAAQAGWEDFVWVLVVCLIYTAIALIIVRPSVREDIVSLGDRKWSK